MLTQNGDFKVLEEGKPVFAESTLISSAGGKARIQFNDGTILTMEENSDLEISTYLYETTDQPDQAAFSFLKGGFLLIAGKIAEANPEGFNLNTPMSTIGIRGTMLIADADPERCLVMLLEGKIDVRADETRHELDHPLEGIEVWVKQNRTEMLDQTETSLYGEEYTALMHSLLDQLSPEQFARVSQQIAAQTGQKLLLSREADGSLNITRSNDLGLLEPENDLPVLAGDLPMPYFIADQSGYRVFHADSGLTLPDGEG